MRAGGLLTLMIALVLGAVAAFMAKSWLEGQAVARVTPSTETATGTIVVAAKALNFGTELSAENLNEIPWSARSLPDGAFATKADLLKDGRRVVLDSLERNEPVLSWKVTGAGQRASLAALIQEGMKAVTVGMDVLRGVAGFVLPGERVDVLLTRDKSGSGVFTDVLLQNVRVLAVDQMADDTSEKPTIAQAVTLEVTTEQAQKLVVATQVGKLSLILRQAGATAKEINRRVSATDLNEEDAVQVAASGELTMEELTAEAAEAAETPETVEVEEPVKAAVNPFAVIGVVRGTQRNEYNVIKE